MPNSTNWSFITTAAMVATASGFICISILGPQIPRANCQYSSPEPQTPPPRVEIPQPPPQQHGFINPLINPADFTPTGPETQTLATIGNQLGGPAIAGIGSEGKFPSQENLKGPTDFILVQGEADAETHRESPYLVSLIRGTVLASVRRPSTMGMLTTPIGKVSFAANSDAFITYNDGVLRVKNVDGLSRTIRVQLSSGPLSGKIYSVQPGYELVVSDHKLTRADLRPNDGVLRRQAQTFDDGYAGASQYQVESALSASTVVAQLSTKTGDAKASRVLTDMSRMASVLNHVQGGAGGFSK